MSLTSGDLNVYRHTFNVVCPANEQTVSYTLEMSHLGRVMVEDLIAACDVKRGYHEDLADTLHKRFGGRQVITAFHHGVQITTYRGGL